MLSYVYSLVRGNPDDFWLNIAAGLPFLAIDILILTLLLPLALQWWDDRRWKPTRNLASGNLVLRFLDTGKVLRMIWNIALIDDGEERGEVLPDFKSRLQSVELEIDSLVLKIESSLQTLLTVFGPKDSREVLSFHVHWSSSLNDLRNFVTEARSPQHSIDVAHMYGEVYQIAVSLAKTGLEYDRILRRYASVDEFGSREGIFWDGLSPDATAQALEGLIYMATGKGDMSGRARAARAELRRAAINGLRLKAGKTLSSTPLTVWDLRITEENIAK